MIVLLIGIFFGVDLTPLLGPGGGTVVTEAPSGPNEIDDETEGFVAVVLAETEDIWGAMFQQSGLQYAEPRLVLFSGTTPRPAASRSRRWGRSTARTTRPSISTPTSSGSCSSSSDREGEFARAYVIAHEVGHHVQDELGVLEQVNAQRSRVGERQSNALSVRVELQADCYAGIWANAVQERLQLTEDDIRSALDTAARIGDDALQRASQGVVVPDSFTHGSSEQRQEWFHRGFRSGDPEQCDTFSARGI